MDVEATRKAMGMSRKELATKAGVTESAVWSVEHGKNPRGGEEVRQAVLRALDPLQQAEPQVDEPANTSEKHAKATAGQSPGSRGGKKLVPVEMERPDWTYRYEWDGLASGDPCKVDGEPQAAKFLCHVVTEKGNTHITVLMGGSFRSFAPDRVHATTKRKRRMAGEGLDGRTDWTIEVLTLAGETHTLNFASYADCRVQGRIEVEHGGKVKILNYHGTVVEVMPLGWTETVGKPEAVTA